VAAAPETHIFFICWRRQWFLQRNLRQRRHNLLLAPPRATRHPRAAVLPPACLGSASHLGCVILPFCSLTGSRLLFSPRPGSFRLRALRYSIQVNNQRPLEYLLNGCRRVAHVQRMTCLLLPPAPPALFSAYPLNILFLLPDVREG